MDVFAERMTNVAGRWLEEQQLAAAYMGTVASGGRSPPLADPHCHRPLAETDDTLYAQIQGCVPKRDRPSYGPDVLECLLHWFVAWAYSFCPNQLSGSASYKS